MWFSYITKGKYEKTYDKARSIIDGIIANHHSVVIVSDLVALEMVSILRSKGVQKEAFTHAIKCESRIADALKWKIDLYTKEFLAKITESTMAKKLVAVESTIPTNEFSRAHSEKDIWNNIRSEILSNMLSVRAKVIGIGGQITIIFNTHYGSVREGQSCMSEWCLNSKEGQSNASTLLIFEFSDAHFAIFHIFKFLRLAAISCVAKILWREYSKSKRCSVSNCASYMS